MRLARFRSLPWIDSGLLAGCESRIRRAFQVNDLFTRIPPIGVVDLSQAVSLNEKTIRRIWFPFSMQARLRRIMAWLNCNSWRIMGFDTAIKRTLSFSIRMGWQWLALAGPTICIHFSRIRSSRDSTPILYLRRILSKTTSKFTVSRTMGLKSSGTPLRLAMRFSALAGKLVRLVCHEFVFPRKLSCYLSSG